MMIGEFDYTDIFYGDQLDFYPEITYIMFVVFMIIMSIIIMNLLVRNSRKLHHEQLW